jgi:hypothetical protein
MPLKCSGILLVLTANDLPFLLSQIKHLVLKHWKSNEVQSSVVIPPIKVNQICRNQLSPGKPPDKKTSPKEYSSMGPPLFSVKKDCCIFYSALHCGALCGSGEIIVCERRGDHWNVVYRYTYWISWWLERR